MDLISSSGGKDNGPDGKEEFGRYIVSGCHLAMLNVKSWKQYVVPPPWSQSADFVYITRTRAAWSLAHRDDEGRAPVLE